MAFRQSSILLLALLVGCASSQGLVKLPVVEEEVGSSTEVDAPEAVVLASFEQVSDDPPPLPAGEIAEPVEAPQGSALSAGALSVDQIEQMALANNPVVGQAFARVQALRGKWLQIGLPPNPTIGYLAGEIGDSGTAGQQGGYAGQRFVTAGKLQKNRAVVSSEIEKAEQELVATRQRVRTDARLSFYRALVAQARVEQAASLVGATQAAVRASQELLDAAEISRAALLQTEVEEQNARIVLRTAENEQTAAWRDLNAVLGDANLPIQNLAGNPNELPGELDWDATLARVTAISPEMAAAMTELMRSRRAVRLACAQRIPDINTQVSVQYDNSTDYTIAGVQVGVALPLWNRNQGGIREARSEVAVASQNIERVALNLQQRLAEEFREYSNAKTLVETYSAEILPRADQSFDLLGRGYAAGEVGYLELLTAQRTYAQTHLRYLDALGSLWRSWTRIDGLLLEGSLTETL